MNRFLLILFCCCAAPVCHAQTAPRFDARVAESVTKPVAGTVTVRVGKDTASVPRPAGVYFAVRITRTGETFRCDSLPYTLNWDTTKAPDGWHWVEILLVDPAAPVPETVIDSLKLYVRNKSTTPLPEALPVATSAVVPTSRPTNRPLATRRRGRGGTMVRMVSPPEAVTVEAVPATFGGSDAPLSVPRVTCLAKSGTTIYLGLPDGGIAAWDEAAKRGYVVRIGGAALGAVRTLAAGNGYVYWTTGASDRVYAFRAQDKTVSAFDAGEAAPVEESSAPWIERMAVLGSRLVLMGRAATRVWDGGASLQPLAQVLPEPVAQTYSDALTQCYVGTGTGDALLVFATPEVSGAGASLHLFSGDARDPRKAWRDRGMVTTSARVADSDVPAPLVTPGGVLVAESEGYGAVSRLTFLSCVDANAPVNPTTVPLGTTGDYNARAPQSAEVTSIGASGVWWAQKGIVFRADLASGKRECYLPWNGAGGMVTALLADKDGAFVATDKGVRRVVPGSPSDKDGYNGYVRAPLGEEYTEPRTPRDSKLLMGVEEWQGSPYKWGGTAKTGTDCSGFVGAMHQALGVSIPRTSSAMGTTKQGVRVTDELRLGDTLVYPGHVALYLGNGRTAETVGGDSQGATGSVSRSTIWRRRDVIVKRFLP